MRRSKREMRMGEVLRFGQEWAPVDELDIWTVKQVHRVDCVAILERVGETRRVSFADLAKEWEPADAEVLAA